MFTLKIEKTFKDVLQHDRFSVINKDLLIVLKVEWK